MKKLREGKVFEFYPLVLCLSVVRQNHSVGEKAKISQSLLPFNWFLSYGSHRYLDLLRASTAPCHSVVGKGEGNKVTETILQKAGIFITLGDSGERIPQSPEP
jgi:hypothetical protein